MDRVAVRGRQPGAAPNNLPHHLTSFVGREADLRSLKGLLGTARLVTLTGTGGAGKSRLAAEVAKANPTLWPDGAWWIELAATDDVSGAVVATLELPGRGPALDVISSWLAARRALLVLDNCEHLVSECAAFCQRVLARCPQLSIIATSREALGVSGEARWPVASLRDPDATLLFESRARLVSPGFKVAAGNREPVTEICERLDRLPLAIEMAAARIDVMSEQELLSNLNDRFRFLTSGTRTVPQRQQTMQAAIDWSFRLMTDDEVRLFRRLSIFQGGFTPDGAQAVCADETDSKLMGLLGDLVRKSMVVADRLDDGSTRFRLLESHHAYALERLLEAGELELMNKRHYEYYVGFSSRTSSRTGPKYEGPAPGIAELKWKARETANLWAALTWARDHTDDMGLSLALEVTASQFIDHARGTALLLDLLGHSDDSVAGELRAKALIMAALRLSRQGDPETGQSLADTSVTLARQLADPELLAYILNSAGMVYDAGGKLDAAVRICEEADSLLKGSSNLRLTIGVKNALGLLAVERGDYLGARDLLTECVALSRTESNVPRMAQHLESLANAQLGLGDIQGATASWTEALSVFRDLNDPFGTIWCLGGLALVAAAHGDHERTLRLAAVADRMSHEWSLSTSSFRLHQLDEACRQARAGLGDRKSEGAWNDGQTMSSARALEYALGEGEPEAGPALDAGPLSRREREVAAMVAAGMTNRQIADRLFIAERTAEGHVERIRNKLGVRSRTEVATWAVERGLVGRHLDKNPPASSV
ncbi:MAG TPA: LuxR C-terminal-related transcriptional regulator [Candidatus Dormibacteraeota bacterium]|nr:LuxR C-terminal-related transcriptional regulator [Candidatus Dormibacteraeota bacterium]